MSVRFGIIDYGMGNLRSVRNAFEFIGADVVIVERGEDLAEVGAVVLPGVGAFGRGMEGLRSRGFVEALERHVRQDGKPMLGICLGMQLFAKTGLELGEHEGLGWVDAVVERLPSAEGLRIPHIGWNDVHGEGPLFAGMGHPSAFYFVHSFHVAPAHDGPFVSGRTEHGARFVSAVSMGNVHGVQFHPEKSHRCGIQLLRNFVALARGA